MSKLLAVVLFASACYAHDQALERKVDELAARIAANERATAELRKQVEVRTAEAPVAETNELERKLDGLNKKLDVMIANRPPPSARPSRPEPDRSKTYAIQVDGFPFDGPAAAKVTLVMAHDYADPFSHKSRPVLDELRKKYGTDLRVVFRNLVVHPRNAMAGALASCAAAKQKKFSVLEDLLWDKGFQNRQLDPTDIDTGQGTVKCWDTADGCAHVVAFAQEAGLHVDRFKADMKACLTDVMNDQRDLQTFGLAATPSWFINGRYTSGAMPIESFAALIDEELAKANERIKAGTPVAKYYKTWVLGRGLTKLEPTP